MALAGVTLAATMTLGLAASAQSLVVLDLGGVSGSAPGLPQQLPVQACVGLFNREASGTAAYTIYESRDLDWLRETEGITDPTLTDLDDFLQSCLGNDGVASGWIRYNWTAQQAIVPNLLTLAAVLDAVPLEDGDTSGAPLVFDAVANFGLSPDVLAVTTTLHETHVNETSTLAMMNPGYDWGSSLTDPPLTGSPTLQLADFVVKDKLFEMYLPNACVPGSDQHSFMQQLVQDNPWPRPIDVYGYDDTWPLFGGDTFEAETLCVLTPVRNMGQVASDSVNNLAFHSRKPPISSPLTQNVDPDSSFNASKTYVAIVLGDNDNVGYVKGRSFDWMRQRVEYCAADSSSSGCFPLVWTMSPKVKDIAPDWLTWYFNQSHATGSDYFMLPPSGYSYAYPGEMSSEAQHEFVAATEQAAAILSTSATVDWEFAGGWKHSIEQYFPLYSRNAIVTGFVAVQVPFDLPVLPFAHDEFFKVLGEDNNIVLFKPREWRGTGGKKEPFSRRNYLPVEDMAAEINHYPAGTVTCIYLTSDGGADLDTVYDLVRLLDEHVELINHNQAIKFALASRV